MAYLASDVLAWQMLYARVKTKIKRRNKIMKKLATMFIAALMVAGLTTSAFAVGPVGQERGRDNRSYQNENVRGGSQGRYESGRNGNHGRFGHGWGHHGAYAHGWSHHSRFGHGYGWSR